MKANFLLLLSELDFDVPLALKPLLLLTTFDAPDNFCETPSLLAFIKEMLGSRPLGTRLTVTSTPLGKYMKNG